MLQGKTIFGHGHAIPLVICASTGNLKLFYPCCTRHCFNRNNDANHALNQDGVNNAVLAALRCFLLDVSKRFITSAAKFLNGRGQTADVPVSRFARASGLRV